MGNKYSAKGTNSSGFSLYTYADENLKINNDQVIARFGSTDSYLLFTESSGSSTPFKFQNITGISVTTGSSSKLSLAYSSNNSSYTSVDLSPTSDGTHYTGSVDLSSINPRYIKLVGASSSTINIYSITISYSCSNTYVEPEEESLSGKYSVYIGAVAGTLVLDFDNNVYQQVKTTETINFYITIVNDGGIYTITKDTSKTSGSIGNSYKLFSTGSSSNNTLLVIDSSTITLTTYSGTTGTNRTFTKQ